MSEKRIGIIMHGREGASADAAASRRVPSPRSYFDPEREP
jgi:hypothetical protein